MLEKEQLEELYNKGLSMKEIANKLGCSENKIDYWMGKSGIPRRSRSEASYYGYWRSHANGKEIPPFSFGRQFVLEEVKSLYFKNGFSAQEIGKTFGKSTSSVYDFMREHDLQRRLPAETNNFIYERKQPSFCVKNNLSQEEEKLKIAGIMLYWAEGGKEVYSYNGQLRGVSANFANSDPEMIKLFLKFLREICGVSEQRLRAHLYCYANQDVDYLRGYWQEITNIPLTQFIKPYVRQDFSPEKKDKMKYGLIHVVYSDKKLFLQIMDWIKEYLRELA